MLYNKLYKNYFACAMCLNVSNYRYFLCIRFICIIDKCYVCIFVVISVYYIATYFGGAMLSLICFIYLHHVSLSI